LPRYKELKKYNLEQLGNRPPVESDNEDSAPLVGQKRDKPDTKVVKLSDLIKKMKEEKAGIV
jgi:hypothetical protein